jgi:hypothetical protein
MNLKIFKGGLVCTNEPNFSISVITNSLDPGHGFYIDWQDWL